MAGESGEQLSSDSGLCDNMFQAAKTQSHEMDDALTESRIVSTTLVKLGADVAALNARGLWPGMLAAGVRPNADSFWVNVTCRHNALR